MANPISKDVHLDAALTDLAINWGPQQYIWDRVAPVVPVDFQSDKYHIWTLTDFRQDETTALRAPGTLAERGQYTLSEGSYYCHNYAWGKSIHDEVNRNADAALRLQQQATKYCTEVINRRLEIVQAAAYLSTGAWDSYIVGAAARDTTASPPEVIYWSTYATSTPIIDVRWRADTMQQSTGIRPNKLLMGRRVYSTLLDHPDFIDRLSVNTTRAVNLAILAELFEVDEVIVGQASYDASGTATWVHGNHALLYYAPSGPTIDDASAVYGFQWGPRGVLNYRDSPAGKLSDVIEVHEYIDFRVTSSALGCMFSEIIQ